RHGSIRSPIWRGGGIVFGPHPRDYSYSVPKKVKRVALKSALSAKVKEGKLIVLDTLTLAEPKTREMIGVIDNLKVNGGALFVTAERDLNVEKSTRNIPGFKSLEARQLNVYDLLDHDNLVLTRDAVARVEEVLA
ncbi:50S ribosomal protein L4, partial [Desulforudis sp. 1190]